MTTKVRGVRGAITVAADTAEDILEGTRTLLEHLLAANAIVEEDVASVLFTTTPDLTAAFPAKAARELGWRRVALLGAQEMPAAHGIPLCVRVLILWNTDKTLDDVRHVYMRDAEKLREDLYPQNRLSLIGDEA